MLNLVPDASVRRGFRALLGNTASPTMLRAGNKINVIPGFAEAEIDGRILPGQTGDDFMRELREVLGADIELEVMHSLPPVVTEPKESSLYSLIHEVMAERAPDAPTVPFVTQGFTDAKAFTSLGTKWYGFVPVMLPPTLRFADMFHGHNERIPVDGLAWGTQAPSVRIFSPVGLPIWQFLLPMGAEIGDPPLSRLGWACRSVFTTARSYSTWLPAICRVWSNRPLTSSFAVGN
jgi:hypothetical protein